MFWTKANPKAVWSRRLRKHTSESVLMVSELLCTGVQGNTQEHKQGNARETCSCWETVSTPPHVNLESGVTLKIQQSSHSGAGQHSGSGSEQTNQLLHSSGKSRFVQ